ncbi:MAG: efflux RND transporter periplasmic adaptor subunit [Gemmataceae bacterium]
MTFRPLPVLRAAVPLFVLAAGCARPQPALAPTKPPDVVVASPTVQEVNDYEDFTGRTEAFEAVDIRARVTGYLTKIEFKDGADVRQGAPLFQIDPTLYQAEVDRSKATLAQTKALVKQAEAELDRASKDFARVIGSQAVSREEVDRITGEKAKAAAALTAAEAAVGVAQASLRTAEQNLAWCRITAPLSGRLSRRSIDPGNLVKADDTVLTSIVATDPIYANFDVDDRTLLRIRRLIREGKVTSARERQAQLQIGLPDEDGFSFTGVIDFADNKLDPGTGTLRVRATVKNESVNNNRLLTPGQFVRVRLPIGVPRKAVLVPEEALGTDQGQKFVCLVREVTTDKGEKAHEVAYRPVKVGQAFGPLRVIESGVTDADRVIVSGQQRVRPGAKVTPKEPAAAAKAKAPPAQRPSPLPPPKVAG